MDTKKLFYSRWCYRARTDVAVVDDDEEHNFDGLKSSESSIGESNNKWGKIENESNEKLNSYTFLFLSRFDMVLYFYLTKAFCLYRFLFPYAFVFPFSLSFEY